MSDAFEPVHDGDGDFFQSRLAPKAKELPFRPDVMFTEHFMGCLPLDEDAKGDPALRSIVANLALGEREGVSFRYYSRDNSYYAQSRAELPPWCSRKRMTAAIARGVAAVILADEPAPPQVQRVARLRSRVSLTPEARELLANTDLRAALVFCGPEIVVRERDTKRLIEPREYPKLKGFHDFERIVACVKRYNAFVAGVNVDLDPSVEPLDVRSKLTLGRLRLTRSFSGDFRLGGRFYGATVQGLPQEVRKSLIVNGEPVVELDFQALHYRLLMIHAGRSDPLGGLVRAHTLDPFERLASRQLGRSEIKLAFNIMINARDRKSARLALATKLGETRDCVRFTALRMAERAMRSLEQGLPECEAFWCSDLGIKLQRIDSDICADVLDAMTAARIPTLPVHDSFIVPASKSRDLELAMESALLRCLARITAGFYLHESSSAMHATSEGPRSD